MRIKNQIKSNFFFCLNGAFDCWGGLLLLLLLYFYFLFGFLFDFWWPYFLHPKKYPKKFIQISVQDKIYDLIIYNELLCETSHFYNYLKEYVHLFFFFGGLFMDHKVPSKCATISIGTT
jgi:hypothetical protein